MAQRTIQSPGVEINEVDLSLGSVNKIGTTIFVTGFSPQGPSDEIVQVSSLSEFETIYGQPTNSAERYFYHTVAQSFNSRANIMVNRLPYGPSLGDGFTNKYWATVYPAVPVNQQAINAGLYAPLSANIAEPAYGVDAAATVQFSPASAGNMVYYYIGKPTFLSLTQAQYNSILDDSAISWSDTPNWTTGTAFSAQNDETGNAAQLASLAGAAVITLNTAKTTINNSNSVKAFFTYFYLFLHSLRVISLLLSLPPSLPSEPKEIISISPSLLIYMYGFFQGSLGSLSPSRYPPLA